ncbi:hypothetical protein [Fundidesulfovibrio butyratiphilus]
MSLYFGDKDKKFNLLKENHVHRPHRMNMLEKNQPGRSDPHGEVVESEEAASISMVMESSRGGATIERGAWPSEA